MSTKQTLAMLGLVAGVFGGGMYFVSTGATRAKEQCIEAGMEFYFQRDFPGNAEGIMGFSGGARNPDVYLWDAYFNPESIPNLYSSNLKHAAALGRTARSWVETQCSQ